jgi:hypothetical protein
MRVRLNQKKRILGLTIALTSLIAVVTLANGCLQPNREPVIYLLEADREWVELRGKSEIECLAFDPDDDEFSYQWVATGGTISAGSAAATWIAPDAPGEYTITATVTDDRGGEVTAQLTLEARANEPPVIEDLIEERTVANRAESIVVQCLASDPDGDKLTYLWSATGGSFSGSGPAVAWMAPETLGTYTLNVEVSDGRGGEAARKQTIVVMANHSPIIESLTADSLSVLRGESVGIDCFATDADGDRLTYSWQATEGKISGEGDHIIWTTPNVCATHTVTVTVMDERGSQTTQSIAIRVRKPG